ncbi:MAG TPA: hypothetical protein DD412_07465 [Holosporales bacterium]|nr:hypothetical protein [Holosporales bacterium]
MYSMHIGIISRSKGSTVDALAYRAGVKLECPLTGEIFNRESKEVEDVILSLPKESPDWAVDLKDLIKEDRTKGVQEFCNIVESAENRKDSQVYREFRISIPREFTKEQGKEFINDFVQDQVCGLGITALKNFHFDVNEETGETNPHCHVVALTRGLTETGLGLKERDWNKKQVHEQWRSQLAAYGNYHLLKNGFEANWDHRSYKDRGINFEPQPKLGSKIIKMESQAGQDPKDIHSKPVTERGREYQEVKLRNLYTLINRPEEALDSVSKQQVTFMWGDVAKVIARYVDDQALFERLSLKIQNSPELVCLKKEGSFTESIFTTRTRLAEEKKFVDTINVLKGNKNHGVNPSLVESSIEKANIQLRESKNDPKASLSDDQVNAIKHMSLSNQLSFVEGYAGAGKTTVMKVMKEIWETSGYQVFGLAPTGKAAENLADCGISSDTVHGFLKSFEHGRSQYDSKTIIVLDEAGMVDHQRFHGLIQAVEKLGIKLVASGDRGQLSPVEAGVPFRLAVAEAGKADLTTVLRQKVPWQKEATVLFGQGRAEEALKAYLDKGHIHFCDEKKPRDVVEQYNLSRRIAGNMGHEIQRDIKIAKERGEHLTFSSHTDYGLFLEWKNTRDACVKDLYGNIETYRDQMRNLGVDGIDFAKKVMKCRLASFGDAYALAKDLKIDWRDKAKHSCDPRFETKQRLIADWFQSTKAHPSDSQAMMAFSNKDVQELNGMARDLKRGAGELGKEEYIYTIERNAGEELGRPQTVREERRFSVGDQIVFTKIDKGLGVNNGTLGRVTELSKSNIKVAIEKDGVSQEISFSPNLYKRFDNGWAVTIHKNQGATVDLAFVLASFEQYKNLAYVALTRHAKNVQVYASRFEFWRDEKLPERLGHAQDKLSSLDYVSSDRALELLQSDEKMLGSSLKKVGQRLEAVGYVGQRAWSTVCDKFLGRPVESNLVRIDRDIENLKSEADRAAEKFNPTPERGVGDRGQALGPQQGLYKPEGNSKVKGVEAGGKKTSSNENPQPSKETIIRTEKGGNKNVDAPSDGFLKKGEGATPLSSSKTKADVSSNHDRQKDRQVVEGSVVAEVSNDLLHKKSEVINASPKTDALEKPIAAPETVPSKLAKKEPQLKDINKVVLKSSSKSVTEAVINKAKGANKTPLSKHDFKKFVKNVEGSIRIEDLAKDLLGSGNINSSLSNSSKLRFGRKGSLSINLTGLHAGSWKNWESNERGSILSLVQAEKGLDFNGALSYVRDYCRGSASNEIDSFLKGEKGSEVSPAERQAEREASKLEQQQREKEALSLKEAKLSDISALIEKTRQITGTPAETYLRKERGIQGELSDSLRYLPAWTTFTYSGHDGNTSFGGALVSVAKDLGGKTTAVQLTYLTAEGERSKDKAGEKYGKKSFGVVKGSFVELQKGDANSPIVLAEGVETALSVKEAGIKGSIYCSLGTSNMENLEVKDRDVIIAGDWDGSTDKPSWLSTEKAKVSLEEKGNRVQIILPVETKENSNKKLDFNDLLTSDGVKSLQSLLQGQVPGLITSSLLPRENQSEHNHEKINDISSNKTTTDLSKSGSPTEHVKTQEKPLEQSAEISDGEKLKANIKDYLTQELCLEKNKHFNKENIFKHVESDPLGYLKWWQDKRDGAPFDPQVPLAEQQNVSNNAHGNISGGIPERSLNALSSTDDFVKDLKSLDDVIRVLSESDRSPEKLDRYSKELESKLLDINDKGVVMDDLKERYPEVADRAIQLKQERQQIQHQEQSVAQRHGLER